MFCAVDSQAIAARPRRWHMPGGLSFRDAFNSHGVLGYHLTDPVIPNAAHGIATWIPSYHQEGDLKGEAGKRSLLFGTQIW